MKKDEEHHKRKEKKQKDMYEGKGKTNHTDRHKNNTKQGNKQTMMFCHDLSLLIRQGS